MTRYLFISDLHLDESRPKTTAAFLTFIRQTASQAKALYILGDWFEVWLGDDMCGAWTDEIAEALWQISQQTKLYFMPGNRDLLLGDAYLKRCGMTRLNAPHVLNLGAERAVLCHGDELCLDDLRHQRYRRWVTRPWVQKAFLMLSKRLRHKIAQKLRSTSQGHLPKDQPYLADVSPGAAEALLARYDATLLIHGHTHRAAIHCLTVNGKNARRVVLSDWHDEACYWAYDESA
jgi:UDP-2,3-diacylglucosamine hydrolase